MCVSVCEIQRERPGTPTREDEQRKGAFSRPHAPRSMEVDELLEFLRRHDEQRLGKELSTKTSPLLRTCTSISGEKLQQSSDASSEVRRRITRKHTLLSSPRSRISHGMARARVVAGASLLFCLLSLPLS